VSLNPPSLGEFDLGLLNTFGLEQGRVIRGGYSLLGPQSDGSVSFSLPKEEQWKSSLGAGSYSHYFLGQQAPHISYSYDRAENNFPYELNGQTEKRTSNAHQRHNVRTWWREDQWQIWSQLLFVDLELPGSTAFPPYNGRSETLRSTTAVSGQWQSWRGSARADFQNQRQVNSGTNRWFSVGGLAGKRIEVSSAVLIDLSFDQSLDQMLSSPNLKAPDRWTSEGMASALVSPAAGHLLHPRFRMERTSDINQNWGFQPGLGGRHRFEALEQFSFLWNIGYFSKAPSFFDLYYEDDFFLSNPSLKREQAWHSDLGFEFTSSDWDWQQSVFIHRKKNIAEVGSVGSQLQTQNRKSALVYGTESLLLWRALRWVELQTTLTWMKTYVSDQSQSLWNWTPPSQSRPQLYQPEWQMAWEPRLFPHSIAQVTIPLHYRCHVQASSTGTRVGPQWDLGLEVQTQSTRAMPLQWKLEVSNLLGWNREETLGYPLGNSPHLFLAATKTF
jgi:hypothetical protein